MENYDAYFLVQQQELEDFSAKQENANNNGPLFHRILACFLMHSEFQLLAERYQLDVLQ